MVAEVRAIRVISSRGAIVNTSSVGSFAGNPERGAYGATRKTVNNLTETAAIEYGPEGIRVNAIVPGPTMTSMISMIQRWIAREPSIIE